MTGNIVMNLRNRLHKPELKPGDFWWSDLGWKKGSEKSARIYVVFPPKPDVRAKFEIQWAPCSVDGGNTAEDRHWNGDYDKPTIAGSWGIDHYHCTITNGVMVL